MEKFLEFVKQHSDDDVTRLILDKAKWPDIDIDLAAACIESRRKLKGKVAEWYENQRLIFPVKLSAEQCSSTATGLYKALFAARIAGKEGWRLADLTGGLGVDSWMFSRQAGEVLYNEMQEKLCKSATHNFNELGAGNIRISNAIATPNTIEDILKDFDADIVYMDPARRGEGGKKVFLIEECTPDVLTIKDIIFKRSRHILIKLSPMADISMVCDRLGRTCREVHCVAYDGECKELLIWMDREWDGEYQLTAVELPSDYPSTEANTLTFSTSEERNASLKLIGSDIIEGQSYLFEPGKALMKAGAFNVLSERFSICKLGRFTHYYLTDSAEKAEELRRFGKIFQIGKVLPLDKRNIKSVGKEYPKAEVTARNIPMDTETLRKKLGVTSGDDAHIFGLKSDNAGNLLFVVSRI